MSEKQKAAPVCETEDGSGGQMVLADIISRQQSTTAGGHAQERIAQLLLPGAENAVPLRQLIAWTGIDGRTVRMMIERERRSGTPILSDCRRGYYLAADELETAQFVESMRHCAHEILTTASAVERAAGLD